MALVIRHLFMSNISQQHTIVPSQHTKHNSVPARYDFKHRCRQIATNTAAEVLSNFVCMLVCEGKLPKHQLLLMHGIVFWKPPLWNSGLEQSTEAKCKASHSRPKDSQA